MKNAFMRFIAIALACMMVFTSSPEIVAFAQTNDAATNEEQTGTEEAQMSLEEIMESGLFYIDTASGSIPEGETYSLKIARGGNSLPASSVRVAFIDISSHYGEDYTVSRQSGDTQMDFGSDDKTDQEDVPAEEGISPDEEIPADEETSTEGDVETEEIPADEENPDYEEIPADEENPVYEDAMTDEENPVYEAAPEDQSATKQEETVEIREPATDQGEFADEESYEVQGSAEDKTDSISLMDQMETDPDSIIEVDGKDLAALSQDELDKIYEEDSAELSDYVSEELGKYVQSHFDSCVVPAEEGKESSQGFLSRAFTTTTGLKDERTPMTSDGSVIFDTDSMLSGYTLDTLKSLTDELHSANMALDFQEGETEKLIDIQAIDNDTSEGDRMFMAVIMPDGDAYNVSQAASFTGQILDDEDWDLPAIEFAKAKYSAKDGNMEVVLKRSGITSIFSGVKITTKDGSAVSGRDYSQVESVVFFPVGIEERTVNIPVRGDYLEKKSTFQLILSDPENASLGEKSEAKGLITPKSGDYFKSESVYSLKDQAGLRNETTAYDSKTVPIELDKNATYREDDGCDAYYDSDGYVYLKADGSDVVSPDRRWAVCINNGPGVDQRPYYAYSGLKVDWEKSGGGNSKYYIYLTNGGKDKYCFDVEENDNGWDRYTEEYYFAEPNNSYLDMLYIANTHNGSAFYKKNKLKVYSAELIPRQFDITASVKNEDDLKFVNDEGKLVSYKEAKLPGVGEFTLSGQNDKGVTTKYTGDTVTVNTDETFTYIKSLWIGSKKITADYPSMTKSVSFALDEAFLKKYGNQITYQKSGSAYKGVINVKVELGQYESEINLHNDDKRATLDFVFDANQSDRKIVKGDYVAIRQTIKDEYKDSYNQSQVRFISKKTTKDNPEKGSKDFTWSSNGDSRMDTYLFCNEYSVVDAYPQLDDKENQVIIRVKDEDIAKFKPDVGIFARKSLVNKEGYTDYIAVDTDQIQAGTRYELEAEPTDTQSVAVWKPAFKTSSYSQDVYWFEADGRYENNVITLTCQQGEDKPFSIKGQSFYSNVSLIGNAEGEAWMPANDVVVQITPMAFGLTDEQGSFQTVPMYGVEGCKVVYKVDAMGHTDYRTVTLSKEETETVSDMEAYSVDVGTFKVSPISRDVPYISAASLTSGSSSNGMIAYLGPPDKGIQNTFTVYVYNDQSTYIDNKGEERTETVQDVELYAYDPLTNELRGQICALDDNQNPVKATRVSIDDNGRSEWKIDVNLQEGESFYRPSDRVYVRLVTDRVKAEAYDPDGNPVENDSFKQTVYPDIYTGFVLSASDNVTPPTFEIDALDKDLTNYIDLPIFKSMNCTVLMNGFSMSFQMLPGGVHRFAIGKILNDHDYINDTKEKFDGFSDGVNKISEFGKKVKEKGRVGVPGWGVYPFLGIYLDFGTQGIGADSNGMNLNLTLLGGGIYFGVSGNCRATLYLPFVVPFYIGIDASLTAYAAAGFHNTETISYQTVQDGSAPMGNYIDPEFTFKAESHFSGYAGFGLARTLGVRGGITIFLQYIYYPTVRQVHPDYDTQGFKATINLRIWLDAFFISIPIPFLKLVDKPYGYFKDVQNDYGKKKANALSSESPGQPVIRQVEEPSRWMPSQGWLRSSPQQSDTQEIVLQNGGFDHASPQLLDMGDDGVLLVFLTGDSSKATGDQSSLVYSVYKDGTWSKPQRICNEQTMNTGDFQPNLCDAGDQVMITWVSRADKEYTSNLEYLGLMDIYSCMFDKNSHEVTEIECLTDGDYLPKTGVEGDVWLYDASPVGIYDLATGDRMVYYQKSEVEEKTDADLDPDLYKDFGEDSKQILANVSPTQNKNFITYMLYDNSQKKWAKDHIYEEEYPDEESREYLIQEFGGQRFLQTPVDEGDLDTDTPTIIDFEAISYNGVGIYAYTIDRDNNLSTEYDRDLFLQVYDFARHMTFHSIRLTNDEVSDARPQLVRNVYGENGEAHTWLFWLEGASIKNYEGKQDTGPARIRYLDVARLVTEGINEDGTIGKTIGEGDEAHTYDLADEVCTFCPPQGDDMDTPNLGSYIAYVDKNNDIYVQWLQQINEDMTGDEANFSGLGTQEIFAAALTDRVNGSSWSDPVQLSHSGMVNDEVTLAVDKDNRLITVGNQYSIDEDSADVGVDDLKLTMMTYEDCGSMKATDVLYSEKEPMPGETITATAMIRNVGLKKAEGYELNIYEVKNGTRGSNPIWTNTYIPDVTREGELPGILPGHVVSDSFDWTIPEDLSNCKSLSLCAEVTELGVEKNATITSDLEGIGITPHYVVKNVTCSQEEGKFYLKYEIANEGNVSYGAGDVKILAKYNDLYRQGHQATWIEEPVEPIEPKESAYYVKELDISPDLMEYGFANGYLDLLDRDGESLGLGTDFIAAMEYPNQITINGDPDLSSIELKAGERIELKGDYGPKDFYRGGSVCFSVEDGEIAHMEGNTLVADEVGSTTIKAFITPYGGERVITLNVLEASEKEKVDAAKVQETIDGLPDAGSVTLDDYDVITKARADYDALIPAAKALVDISNLKAAEEKLESLRIDISETTVTGIKKKTYTGKELKQNLTLTYKGKTLVEGKDYKVTYKNNTNAGKASLVIQGLRAYKGSVTKTFTIAKAKNTMIVKAKTAKIKYAKVKKKKQTIARKKVLKISKAKGTLSFVKKKGNKKITIAKKTGKVMVKKGLKKGTYKVKVQVTAAGTANYGKMTKTVTFKMKVK